MAFERDAVLRGRTSVKWREFAADVLPLQIAEMDTALAEPIAAALTAAVDRGDTGYAWAGRLPEAFAAFAVRRYGWSTEPGAVRLVPDVMAGIVEILRHITEPGDRVVVNTPAYPPFFFWLDRIGRTIVENPLTRGPDGYRLDLDRLANDFAAGTSAYLLCSPHNPTGAVFRDEELKAVAELADRHGVRIVVDEIHAPLTYPGVRHVPFGSLDAEAAARSVTLVSASKAWNLPGLKAALAVPGVDARPDVDEAIHEEVSEAAGLFGVIASEAAFTTGEAWLDDLLEELDANRRLVGSLLAQHLPQIEYLMPEATYLAWLDCTALMLGDDPARTFRENGKVALAPGPRFGKPGHGFARLNFATHRDLLTEAVHRMASAVAASAG